MTERFDQKAKGFKEIAWIPVKNISVIWAQAQRPLNEKHAKNIADNFDPEMFGTLAVTKPNGKGIYHAIDGHHRKVAVESIWGGEEKVPCQIFDAEDPARAAQLFGSMNSNRKIPKPIELFKVRVTAKHEIEVGIDKIVRKCGFVVSQRHGHGENGIACVAALKAVYQTHGADILEAALNLARAIWGPDDESAREAFIVRGFGEFLAEYRHVDFKRLREVIDDKYTPARLIAAAKVGKEIHGDSIPAEVKKLMVNCYNHGLRAGSDKKLKIKVQED